MTEPVFRPRGSFSATIVLLALVAPVWAEIRLREVAEPWGLDYRHRHGGSGQRYMPESVVGGVVVFDYDGDGDDDVFFVGADSLPGYEGERPRSRLYRNEGGARFIEITDAAGLMSSAYGSGATAGDIDGDGDLDLYVTAAGPNLLYRNQGDGSFVEVAAAAGVDEPLWSTGAAFADTDGDGDLDLYVANYVAFSLESHRPCLTQGLEVYCHPGAFDGEPDRFFENQGDGTFREASVAAGLVAEKGRAGLGVVFGDLDGDGRVDLFVANDSAENFLFRGLGNGSFEDESLLSGTAYGDSGRPEAGMGVDFGDVDGDLKPDIVVTNFELETNALYRNTGDLLFLDQRYARNIAESSLLELAFGVAFADLDNDRDLDLLVANGHILDNAAQIHENSRFAQRNQVLENIGAGHFRELEDAGIEVERVSRGLAVGDLDGDGDLDVVINNSNDVAEVYENLGASKKSRYLEVALIAATGNRFAVGARVEVEAGDSRQVREVRTASSYLSQSSLARHFGLGSAPAVTSLTVARPSGRVQVFRDLPVDRRLVVAGSESRSLVEP